MQLQVERATGKIVAYGDFPSGVVDPNVDLVECSDDELAKFMVPGVKKYTGGRVVVVPVPIEVVKKLRSDASYAAEFSTPTTSEARKQQIRDILVGLLPREEV